MYQETVYNDQGRAKLEMVEFWKKWLKCDLVICLSHLGYKV
jgi:5'-nucleotidase